MKSITVFFAALVSVLSLPAQYRPDRLVAEHHDREGSASLKHAAFGFGLPGQNRMTLVITSDFAPGDTGVGECNESDAEVYDQMKSWY